MNNHTSNSNSTAPSPPINITTTRGRRGSIASIPALSTSPTSPLPASIQTPASSFSYRFNRPRSSSESDDGPKGGPGGSPTSPLAYFLGTSSPIKAAAGAGIGGSFFGSKVVSAIEEDDDGPPGAGSIGLFGVGGHTRRASWAQTPSLGANSGVSQTPASDRGTGVLRRLSLSSPFQRPLPPAPPPSATSYSPPSPPRYGQGSGTVQQPQGERLRRAATLSVCDPAKKRGISPMGERLLKGHFDGF